METVAVARNAMATRFEIVLHGERPMALRAAAEEALDEIERIESKLTIYRPDSSISRLNADGAHRAVRLEAEVFRLMEWARKLSEESHRAFDVTVGPLLRAWGFVGGNGALPAAEALSQAREISGFDHLQFDAEHNSIRFDREGVMVDLGAIGKGYAVERAGEILREDGVTSALLHGGTSTILAIGAPPEAEAWRVALPRPAELEGQLTAEDLLSVIELRDAAMSVSASWGKSFVHDGKTYGHVLDPRTGRPADRAVMAAVVLPSATETDAFSTALLIEGGRARDWFDQARPEGRWLVIEGAPGQWKARGNLSA